MFWTSLCILTISSSTPAVRSLISIKKAKGLASISFFFKVGEVTSAYTFLGSAPCLVVSIDGFLALALEPFSFFGGDTSSAGEPTFGAPYLSSFINLSSLNRPYKIFPLSSVNIAYPSFMLFFDSPSYLEPFA